MAIKVVVTGGAGFIGSNLVRALNARGEDGVLIVDRLRDGDKWKNLVGLACADVVDKDDFREWLSHGILKEVKTVYHLGACSSTTEKNADYLLDNNYRYTRELCDAALRAGARFVYASSAATYGDGALGYTDDPAVTPSLKPLNMYGFSKHLFDLHALRTGLHRQIAGLKYFNVYGPGEAHKGDQRSMVHKAWGQIKETGKVKLFRSHREGWADGGQQRDFLYVADAVAATLFFGEHPTANGLFNCGTGKSRSWLDLARSVFAALGKPENIEFVDMPDSIRNSYQYFTEANLEKLRRSGYKEEFASLEDGVREYVQFLEGKL